MRPESHASALRDVVTELTGTSDATTYFVKKISGVWQRYAVPGDHPLVGRSAPDLELADGSRLADHLHDGRGVLLDLVGSQALRAGAEGFVPVVTARSSSGLGGLLVRPDGIVAWAADDGAEATDALDAALARWFLPHAGAAACLAPAAAGPSGG